MKRLSGELSSPRGVAKPGRVFVSSRFLEERIRKVGDEGEHRGQHVEGVELRKKTGDSDPPYGYGVREKRDTEMRILFRAPLFRLTGYYRLRRHRRCRIIRFAMFSFCSSPRLVLNLSCSRSI